MDSVWYIVGSSPIGSNQRLQNWYLLLMHAALRRKNKDWLARNQYNESE